GNETSAPHDFLTTVQPCSTFSSAKESAVNREDGSSLQASSFEMATLFNDNQKLNSSAPSKSTQGESVEKEPFIPSFRSVKKQ
ncbi:hypothetical protein P7K49_037668, partial [Saguinus oedipus]